MQYNCGKATMFDENFFEKAGNAIRTRDILVGNEMLYRWATPAKITNLLKIIS